MRAIILAFYPFADEHSTQMAPPFLLPLVDRPFLQHVIERLIDLGITKFDMVLDERTRKLLGYFGKGQRWGSSMGYHIVEDTIYPLDCLKSLSGAAPDEPILLVTADTWHDFTADDLALLVGKPHPVYFSSHEPTETIDWSGWALVNGSFFASLPADGNLGTIAEYLLREAEACFMPNVLHAGSYAELLAAQKRLMRDYVARRATVHPTVKLISPVFIAPNARIERGVTLGPNVVVGEGSVIDANTSVQNSLVCAKTYIGMDLEIKDSILEGGELFHTVLSASLTLREPMFLSRLAR